MLVLLASASVAILTSLADSQQNKHDIYLSRVYSVETPLMMDSGPVHHECISLVFIIRIIRGEKLNARKRGLRG